MDSSSCPFLPVVKGGYRSELIAIVTTHFKSKAEHSVHFDEVVCDENALLFLWRKGQKAQMCGTFSGQSKSNFYRRSFAFLLFDEVICAI